MKNNCKEALLAAANFHKGFRPPPGALQFMPKLLCQRKGLIKFHNPGKFPEDSICSSYFRDSVTTEAIILDLFSVNFRGLLPQMSSNLYKTFTIDAMQSNASHMLRFLMQSEKFLEIKPKD